MKNRRAQGGDAGGSTSVIIQSWQETEGPGAVWVEKVRPFKAITESELLGRGD